MIVHTPQFHVSAKYHKTCEYIIQGHIYKYKLW